MIISTVKEIMRDNMLNRISYKQGTNNAGVEESYEKNSHDHTLMKFLNKIVKPSNREFVLKPATDIDILLVLESCKAISIAAASVCVVSFIIPIYFNWIIR